MWSLNDQNQDYCENKALMIRDYASRVSGADIYKSDVVRPKYILTIYSLLKKRGQNTNLKCRNSAAPMK